MSVAVPEAGRAVAAHRHPVEVALLASVFVIAA